MWNDRNSFYNKSLQPFANSLRKSMTKSEACLWKYVLKSRKMKGYQFRRQRPILKYITDFLCQELKLIIEVDGVTHNFEDTYKNDSIRQKELETYGFTIMRFTDEEVLKNIEGVNIAISEMIEKLECEHKKSSTPLIPRHRGKAQKKSKLNFC